jgi:hypothetical protein
MMEPGVEETLVATKYSLATLEVGEASHCENLTIFPLFAREEDRPEPKRRYELLTDAIAEESAKVEEASEGGEVPFLSVTNQGTSPVLIPEGEILIGAKQNRTVNLTVLVAAQSTFKLPVSCVEQGRWHYRSRGFKPDAYASPKLRERKVRSAQANRRVLGMALSDQSEVWAQVAEHAMDLGAESPTMDFVAGFAASEDRLESYRKKLRLPKGALGFVAARGEQVIGMDLFDASETLEKLWGRLSDAYFLEAVRDKGEVEETPKEAVEEFVAKLADNLVVAESQPGLGVEMEIAESAELAGCPLAGSALWYDGAVVHLAAFGTG